MKVLSLFSGIGGFDLAATKMGWEVVGQVENNPFCQKVLEKHWPDVKRMEDIHDVKGNEFGPIDLICGGPPCQPISFAGKRRGEADDRWLWPEALRIMFVLKPRWAVWENPVGILSQDGGIPFESLCARMESKGYEVQPFIIPAAAIGAMHIRDRVWIIANQCSGNLKQHGIGESNRHTKNPDSNGGYGWDKGFASGEENGVESQGQIAGPGYANWPAIATRLCGMDDGLPVRMDGFELTKSQHRRERLKALGNAVVPRVVFEIFRAIEFCERVWVALGQPE